MVDYTTKSLYDVIKISLLIRDRDLNHFINTMNDEIIDDYNKIKNKSNLTLNDIINKYENYTIVYRTIRGLMAEVNITKHQEKAREITNMYLDDKLIFKSNEKPKNSYEGDD